MRVALSRLGPRAGTTSSRDLPRLKEEDSSYQRLKRGAAAAAASTSEAAAATATATVAVTSDRAQGKRNTA